MEYDRHILNSNNVMRTSLRSKKVDKDHKNHAVQSVNIDGRCTANRQISTDAFNKRITTMPDMINKNTNANYSVTKTSVNNQNKLSYF